MPGMLILEALAQTGGLLLFNKYENIQNKLAMFIGVNNTKFRKAVIPGDQLILEVKLISKKLNIFTFIGKAYVDNQLVTETEFQAALVDR